MMQLKNTANFVQLQLQYELGTILSQVDISTKLCNIKSSRALIPIGNSMEFNTFVYKFAIAKVSDEVIPVTVMQIFKEKINNVINAHRYELMYRYNMLDEISRYELQQQFPLTFNGFRVSKVHNDINDILVDIVLVP